VDASQGKCRNPEPARSRQTAAHVLRLANPGGRGLRVTVGFVSGIDRTFRGPPGHRITGSLELHRPAAARLVERPGSERRRAGAPDQHQPLGEGFYLAIPADDALRTGADALARGESAASPRLGVAIAPASIARRLRRAVGVPDTDGPLIRGVIEDSAAARAGVAQGDLIVAAAGQPIGTSDDLFDALRAAPGATIKLSIVRGTDERAIQVTFGVTGQPDQEA
jgi:membrane-associated protease RseP (regulator of RpoE activity)